MICSLCGEKATYLPYKGRLILEKDIEKKISKNKHYAKHPCPIEVNNRSKDISKIAKDFPHLTRENMIRQKVQQQHEQSSFSAYILIIY